MSTEPRLKLPAPADSGSLYSLSLLLAERQKQNKTCPPGTYLELAVLFLTTQLRTGENNRILETQPFRSPAGPSPTWPGPGQRAPSGQRSFSDQWLHPWLHILFLSFQMFRLFRIRILWTQVKLARVGVWGTCFRHAPDSNSVQQS